jgi:hypothetical protein
MFDRFRRKEAPRSCGTEAAELDAYARIGLDEVGLNSFDEKYRRPVDMNFYFTKAAIVIHWLRILERNIPNPGKARATLEEFERLTFSPLPMEGRLLLADQIRKLITLTVDLRKFAENEALSQDEICRQLVHLSREWFGLITDDEDFLRYASVMHGVPLLLSVNNEMKIIGGKVEAALFGKAVR